MRKISVKWIIDEDFVNYKKPSMTILFPKCSFKCGRRLCQNSQVANMKNIRIAVDALVSRYISNPMTQAVVCQGLEPMDSFRDVLDILKLLRSLGFQDDFVIYTGYDRDEIEDKLEELAEYDNVIVKFGRYLPKQTAHRDDVLGVDLASNNQYAEKLHRKERENDRMQMGRT